MSWANELYEVYKSECGKEHTNGSQLLPISHSTANAQIEVTIDEAGNFKTARTLSKEEGRNTIIPITEQSGGRTVAPAPMPFADKLIYLAGDYAQYVDEVKKDKKTGEETISPAENQRYYPPYLEQLKSWCDSEFTHSAVQALYAYLSKGTLLADLLSRRDVLELDEESGKLKQNVKIAGIPQESSFVRFKIEYQDGISETWHDASLYDSFIHLNSSHMEQKALCYATGELLPITENHPKKLVSSATNAKLISANDESGFSYRGRFATKSEALSVSYEFSQKMHNALKWLVAEKGMLIGGMTIVVWASGMQEIPSVIHAAVPPMNEDDDEDDDCPIISAIEADYQTELRESIFGYRDKLAPNTKVMLLGLDAATPGRLSVSMYTELDSRRFFENLANWHQETAALRYDGKRNKRFYNSFSVYDIVNCAFGMENGKAYLECKAEVLRDNILRLLPCIMEGRPLPADIMWALYHKASNPLAYDHGYLHRNVVEAACGMIHKFNIDHNKGVISMAYDPNETNRSYLYGCLLAIADAAERETYEGDDKNNRVTNARRYWNAFSKRPYETWGRISELMIPYYNKLQGKRVRYEKMIQEIEAKFTLAEFTDNSALEPAYLLGFHHYTSAIFKSNKSEEE